ncbi:MAG: CO dehydrogenase/acetyl-CoA synthase complex subunit epsilon [Promethearchaeota archaeon]
MSKPYQKANLPGPEVGVSIPDPITIVNIINKSSKILMVIGAESVNKQIGDKTYADVLLEIGIKLKADIISTGSAHKYLADKENAEELVIMPLINITDRLRDPKWINLDGKGDKYDLIIFGGFLIYYVSQILSTLRNYTEYRTVSLDRYYHPNARFSLPNLEKDEWVEYLDVINSKF